MKTLKYSDIRLEIQSGDLLEFRTKSVIGGAIRYFTKQNVNHSAIAWHCEDSEDFPENQKFLIEADEKGITPKPLSRIITEFKGEIYWTPLRPHCNKFRPKIRSWAKQQFGAKYDFGSLFANAVGSVNADMRKFFCSEYFFMSLVAGGCFENYYLRKGVVYDITGAPVKAPRPGEIVTRFPKLFGETVKIIP